MLHSNYASELDLADRSRGLAVGHVRGGGEEKRDSEVGLATLVPGRIDGM